MAQLKQTSAETCLDFYDRFTNSIHEAHKDDLSNLANQPEARDGYQRAIKHTVRRHYVAGLHNDIKAQISAKLQSLDTKEKLFMAAAEIEAAACPKNAAAAFMAGIPTPGEESSKIRQMQQEIDAIKSRFGNLKLQQGGGESAGAGAIPPTDPPTNRRQPEEQTSP